MSHNASTLLDVCSTVPHLMPKCVTHWWPKSRSGNIRTLRLVSKDLSRIALQEVTRCFVQLGEGACPEPKQVVHLMKNSKLALLGVYVTTTSARTGPSLAQQLETCTRQMTELLQGMGKAIKSVTELNITMEHEVIQKRNQRTIRITTGSEPPLPSPVPFSIITHTLCTMLAAAVPALTTLTLRGCCRDAAFEAFGASCPLLHTLQLEAISVPITALDDLDKHLPSLKKFVLTSPYGWTDGDSMVAYIGGVLASLQRSTSLREINLKNFDGDKLWMQCQPGDWERVPRYLFYLRCSCEIYGIYNATALLKNLYLLEMSSTSGLLDFAQILQGAPRLLRASILTSKQFTLSCDSEDVEGGNMGYGPAIALLRERVLGGLNLELHSLGLEGYWECVQSALRALPPLPSIKCCTMEFSGVPGPEFLQQVARVFPNLTDLKLQSETVLLGDPEKPAELLGPLVLCKHLISLRVCVELSYSNEDLFLLLLSLPVLTAFSYTECEGVNPTELNDHFWAQKRNISTCDYGPECSWNEY